MTHPETTEVNWLTAEEQRVWRSFLALSRGMQTAIDRQLARDSALSGSEYEVLVLLSESPTGVVRSRDLLGELGWERSRLSHLLSRMARRGLLERLPCDSDARGLDVRVTPEGRGAIEAAAPGHLEMVRAALIDQLTPQEMDTLRSIADKVVPRVKDMGLC
ncbi:MarR family winged helix-turn-helix transcriptional regulator [Kocuria sp. M1R5S2]|uniref:MarR family winged helix-turn-helix transcriptional regulator n=1 Tax=Kocuria rhizosphaerae TaxID=3376285 RepID=UPI0037BBC866